MDDDQQKGFLFAEACSSGRFRLPPQTERVTCFYDRLITMAESPEQVELLSKKKQLAELTFQFNTRCHRAGQGRRMQKQQMSIAKCIAELPPSLQSPVKHTAGHIEQLSRCMERRIALLNYITPLELSQLEGARILRSEGNAADKEFSWSTLNRPKFSPENIKALNAYSIKLLSLIAESLELILDQYRSDCIASASGNSLQFKPGKTKEGTAYTRSQTDLVAKIHAIQAKCSSIEGEGHAAAYRAAHFNPHTIFITKKENPDGTVTMTFKKNPNAHLLEGGAGETPGFSNSR